MNAFDNLRIAVRIGLGVGALALLLPVTASLAVYDDSLPGAPSCTSAVRRSRDSPP